MAIELPRPARAAVFLSLLIAAYFNGCARDEAVAMVNGEPIKASDYERQWRILKSLRPETKSDDVAKRQVLEQMVKQQLLTDEAKREGLDRDPSAKEAMNLQREAVRAELLTTIKNAQAQLDQLDRAVEQKVLIERLLDARKGGLSVGQDELRKAYAEHKRQMAPASVPPFAQMEAQLRQQLLLEKLVESAKAGGQVVLYPDAAARARFE